MVPLWEKGPPGFEDRKDTPETRDRQNAAGEYRVTNVHNPYLTVFLPPTPAPTAGFMMFVRRSELIELDMTVEEAAKLVISAGLVAPEYDVAAHTPPLDPPAPVLTRRSGG